MKYFLLIEYKMATVEELVEQFKQLPDFDRYPLPEVYYTKFNIKKPKPSEAIQSVYYQPPPFESLNPNGKVIEVGPVEGGVREIKEFQTLPVEVKRLNEETQELEDYPPPQKTWFQIASDYVDTLKLISITKTSDDMQPHSPPKTVNPPTADNTQDAPPSLDHLSSNLSDAFPYIASAVPYHLS